MTFWKCIFSTKDDDWCCQKSGGWADKYEMEYVYLLGKLDYHVAQSEHECINDDEHEPQAWAH